MEAPGASVVIGVVSVVAASDASPATGHVVAKPIKIGNI